MKGFSQLGNQNIKITDSLFGTYVDMIANSVLPYQWEMLNDRIPSAPRSQCLKNFRIAAGDLEGAFYGAVFQDSDAYKWLEAAAYCIESGKGDHFIKMADELVHLIARAQQPDGYLNTYFTIVSPLQRWTNLVEGHELYCAGHLIEAAVAYTRATGNKKILDVAVRFADLITKTFGAEEGKIAGYPGHQEIEVALLKLYRYTKNSHYLKTAEYFIRQRGKQPNYFSQEIQNRKGIGIFPEFADYDLVYAQSHKEPVLQREVEGHAVRAMYMCAAMADLALETDDQDMKDACHALWESTTERRMYITGGIGSSGFLERFTTDYDLDNTTMYCETCASVGLMMFGQRMTSLTGDAVYYDAVERALCNTVLAGISATGKKYFYVNPLEVWPSSCLPYTSKKHIKPERQDWFDVACCPTNIARTLASLGQYIYAKDGEKLCINLFISSSITEIFGGEICSLHLSADPGRKGSIRIEVDHSIELKIRIPSYARNPAFSINGVSFDPCIEKGYACISVKENSILDIELNIVPEWTASNSLVRANAGKAALTFGPFVYCFEEIDNESNLSSVFIHSEKIPQYNGTLESLPGNMPSISVQGTRITSGVKGLYGKAQFSSESITLKAVPYCLWCNRTPGEMTVWQRVLL